MAVQALVPIALAKLAAPQPASYATAVAADTPRLWWRLNEASGNFADSSGNGGIGVPTSGTPLYRQPTLLADGDPCIFIGNGHFYDGPVGFDFVGTAPFSFEYWFRKTTVPSGYSKVISVAWTDANGRQEWSSFVRPSSSGQPGYADFERWVDGTVRMSPDTRVSVCDDAWHQIVGVYTGNQGRVYHNGVLTQTTSTSVGLKANPAGSPPVRIQSSGGHWIDEVALYDYALDASRILAHYNAGINGSDAVPGRMFFNTTTAKWQFYNGTTWVDTA